MNSDLYFDGKKYILAKRASQISGYASDYIGQLCRAKKLESKTIGRSWFVSEKSLSDYIRGEESDGESSPSSSSEFLEDDQGASGGANLEVKEISSSRDDKNILNNTAGRITYLEDKGPLIPEIISKKASIEIMDEAKIVCEKEKNITLPSDESKSPSNENIEINFRRLILSGAALTAFILIIFGAAAMKDSSIANLVKGASEKMSSSPVDFLKGITATIKSNDFLNFENKNENRILALIKKTPSYFEVGLSSSMDEAASAYHSLANNFNAIGKSLNSEDKNKSVASISSSFNDFSVKVYDGANDLFSGVKNYFANFLGSGSGFATEKIIPIKRTENAVENRIAKNSSANRLSQKPGASDRADLPHSFSASIATSSPFAAAADAKKEEQGRNNFIVASDITKREVLDLIKQFDDNSKALIYAANAANGENSLMVSQAVSNLKDKVVSLERKSSLVPIQIDHPTNVISRPFSEITSLDGVAMTNSSFSGTTGIFSGNLTVGSRLIVSGTATSTIAGDANFDSGTLFVDSVNKRVGVGTTSPTDTLSIKGPVYLAQVSAPATVDNRLYNNAGNLYWNGALVSPTATWGISGSDAYRLTGNIGIGTTSPNWKLSTAGAGSFDDYLRASYFAATSTVIASVFPQASTTQLSVAGNSWFNGLSTVANLLLTGSTTLQNFTANNSTTTNATSTNLAISGSLNVSGNSTFANSTTTNLSVSSVASTTNLIVSNNSALGTITSGVWNGTTLAVSKGGTGQASFGQGWLNSDGTALSASTSPTVNYIVATSTTASIFPYASTTALTVSGNSYLGTITSGVWNGTAVGTQYGGTGQNFSASSGLINLYSGVASAMATSSLGLLTTNVAEGTNQYWTNTRFDNRLSATTSLQNLTTLANLSITGSQVSNLNTLWDNRFAATSTTGLAEGNNLYWTNTRFDNRLSATTSLQNITNLANLASVGTITSGTWNGSLLAVPYGGTGWASIQSGTIPYGNGTAALSTTTAGTAGNVLALLNGIPTWTATTTLSTIGGTLNLGTQVSGTLGVSNGGTGQTSFGQGWLNSNGTALSASTSPTVNYIVATSTTATSTFATGGLAVGTNQFVVQQNSGNVGIGTTTPNWKTQIAGTRPFLALSDASAGADLKHWYLSSQGGNMYIGTTTDAYATTSSSYQALTVLNNGNVGIGSSYVADGKLSIVKNSSYNLETTAGIYIASNQLAGNPSLILGTDSANGVSYIQTTNYHTAWGTYPLVLQAMGGNVGIGTTNPTNPLTVATNPSSSVDASILINPMTNTNASLIYMNNGGTGGFYAGRQNSSGTSNLVSGLTAYQGVIGNSGALPLSLITNSAARMTIGSAGNVGIGTTSPVSSLSVSGNAYITGYAGFGSTTPVANQVIAVENSAGAVGNNYGIVSDSNGSGATLNVGGYFTASNATTNYALQIGGSPAAGANNYAIYSLSPAQSYFAGNVGINQTNPQAKLDISSSAAQVAILNSTSGAGGYMNFQDSGTSKGLFGAGATLFSNNGAGIRSGSGVPISFSINSATPSMVVDTTGNVGIGTGSPGEELELSKGATGNAVLKFTRNSAANYLGVSDANYIVTGAAAGDMQMYSAGNLWLWSNGGKTLMTGNVGIGTTSPTDFLHIQDATNSKGITIDNTNTSANSLLTFQRSAVDQGYIGIAKSNGVISGSGLNDLAIRSQNNILFAAGGSTENMRIGSTGNVGIGTTTPGAKLDVAGSSPVINVLDTGTSYAMTRYRAANNGFGDTYFGVDGSGAPSLITGGGGLSNAAVISRQGAYPIQFATNNVARMTIDSAGNIGIGTTTPAIVYGNRILTIGSISYPELELQASPGNGGRLGNVIFTNGVPSTGGAAAITANLNSGVTTDAYLAFHTGHGLTTGLLPPEAMRIDSSGNVGIKTTSPIATLQVSASGSYLADSSNAGITVSNAGTPSEELHIGVDSSLGADGSAYIQSIHSGFLHTTLLLNPTGGPVGIGTTSPASLLTLHGPAPILTLGDTQASSREFQIRNGSVAAGKLDIYDLGNATSRLTIDGSGNVGIGTANPGFNFATVGTGAFAYSAAAGNEKAVISPLSNGGQLVMYGANNSTVGIVLDSRSGNSSYFNNGGSVGIGTSSPATLLEVGGATTNVTFDGYKNCAGFTSNANGLLACTASDERMKQNIVSLDGSSGLAALNALNPVSFYWKDASLGTQQQYGFIAQQVKNVFPNLVQTTNPTALTPDGTLTVNYYGLIAPMIKSIQELDGRTRFIANSATSTVLAVTAIGNVGIGTTTPAYKLHIIGDVAATSFVNISTKTAKKDISYVTSSQEDGFLDKIKNMNIAQYRYNIEDENSQLRLGLIAEEAPSEVLSASGKGVDIYKMTSFALAGVKAMQREIDRMKIDISTLSATTSASQSSTVISQGLQWIINEFQSVFGIAFGKDKIQAKNVAAESFEMKDSSTGETYCVKISNGDWNKTKGVCGAASSSSSIPVSLSNSSVASSFSSSLTISAASSSSLSPVGSSSSVSSSASVAASSTSSSSVSLSLPSVSSSSNVSSSISSAGASSTSSSSSISSASSSSVSSSASSASSPGSSSSSSNSISSSSSSVSSVSSNASSAPSSSSSAISSSSSS